MNVKEKEICPGCDRIGTLTADHIVPRVFVRQLRRFGIELPEGYVNKQRICAACNQEKGNSLDMDDPVTNRLVHKLKHEIIRRQYLGETILWGRLEQYRPYLDAIHSHPLAIVPDAV